MPQSNYQITRLSNDQMEIPMRVSMAVMVGTKSQE
jgi:hypothetical protein